MNKESIFTMAWAILGGLIALFAKKYVEALFKAYPPDVKKHIRVLRTIMLFILSYGFPIGSIIYLMVITKAIDKWFVLYMILNSLVLLINFAVDLFRYFEKSAWSSFDMHHTTLDLIKDIVKNAEGNQEQIKSVVGLLKKQNDLIVSLFEAIKKDKPDGI